MTHEGNRAATVSAINTAKESGALISFDPNLREPLWESLKDAKEAMKYGISVCDILKISDNEIKFLTGEKDIDKGVFAIIREYGVPLVLAQWEETAAKPTAAAHLYQLPHTIILMLLIQRAQAIHLWAVR